MRQTTIVTNTYCDVCIDQHISDDEPATSTFTIAIDEATWLRSKPRQLDVCDSHAEPLHQLELMLRDIKALVTEPPRKDAPVKERRPGRNKKASDYVECPLCNYSLLGSSMVNHLMSIHGIPHPAQPEQCPDCNYHNKSGFPHSMTQHRYKAHGYTIRQIMMDAAGKETGHAQQ